MLASSWVLLSGDGQYVHDDAHFPEITFLKKQSRESSRALGRTTTGNLLRILK